MTAGMVENPVRGRDRHEIDCVRARPLLGTLVEIAARGLDAARAVEAAFLVVEEVHRLMSYHDPGSDVSRINRGAAGHGVKVSSHTWHVLQAARRLAEMSQGLFDITVAPTLTTLGFLPRHPGFRRVSPQGNWRHVELLPDSHVRLTRQVRIDLGGIAKGYAVDRAVDALASMGVRAARVNAGGDLRVFGTQAQKIRLRLPGAPTELWPLMSIHDGAVATSADYFTGYWRHGRWVTPLIHPHTRASSVRGRSVTVLARDCLTADALTKIVHADPHGVSAVLMSTSARALLCEQLQRDLYRVAAFDPLRGRGWEEWEFPAGNTGPVGPESKGQTGDRLQSSEDACPQAATR